MYTYIPFLLDLSPRQSHPSRSPQNTELSPQCYTAFSHQLLYTWQCMYVSLSLPVHPISPSPLPVCIHSLCLCLSSCPENWCILKLLCLCVPQKTLHPRLCHLCTSGMYCIHQVKRSPGKSSATSMVLLNLSMIPSNFDQISLGNDNGKLVIENDLKVSGAPNQKLHASLGLEGKGSMGIIENWITQHNRQQIVCLPNKGDIKPTEWVPYP